MLIPIHNLPFPPNLPRVVMGYVSTGLTIEIKLVGSL